MVLSYTVCYCITLCFFYWDSLYVIVIYCVLLLYTVWYCFTLCGIVITCMLLWYTVCTLICVWFCKVLRNPEKSWEVLRHKLSLPPHASCKFFTAWQPLFIFEIYMYLPKVMYKCFSSSYISIDADPNHLGHCYNLEHHHLDILHHLYKLE